MSQPAHAFDTAHSNIELQDALERIYGLHRKEMDFRLNSGPYRELLEKLGNPQNNLPPSIHVAGTNGKGSTIAMMRALAESRGLKVHVYTSPHLFRFNERIRIASELISDEQLLNTINYINTINLDKPLTFFEFTSTMMFHLFATHPADLCLIETGMGGRLDCTNVIDRPDVTVLTSISYDHMDFLGHDIKAIAGEKAGIIKKGVPVILAPQLHDVEDVIKNHAAELDAPLLKSAPTAFLPEIGLKGAHQRDNAATALLAMKQIYPDITWPQALKIEWPGRFQSLKLNTQDLIYDGAHNQDSLKVLGDTLRSEYGDNEIVILLSIQDGKDMGMVKEAFKGLNTLIYTVDLPAGRRPNTAVKMAEALKKENLFVQDIFDNFKQAIEKTAKNHPDSPIIITGSLYAAQLIPDRYWPIVIM